ncbi:ABC transporter permease [Neoroseomonas oryzicola]|uniref:ABC transporter permease n=1 Tax=Neoroseomonas oryzicola TaxID=535904 RepID=A0A9X9WJW4_9PROT|nr:ABC transporter permease [Neoroseomonas oryzicola]MBR0660624.1 ABC transporter permease [Neoroseomonas oryzicola]NKE20017.1 ABC transporter permease [Neoroseomonas oryzicola]
MATIRRFPAEFGYVLPLLLLMLAVFILPIALMLARSVTQPEWTIEHYQNLIETSVYLRVLGRTLRIAVITTIVCAVLGYPLAYWMRGLSPQRQVVATALVVLPFWISILVRTYAWIVVLGNAGVVNRILLDLGLVGAPVAFLYNELGVIIGTTNVLLPFLVLPLFAAMVRIDDRLLHAAESLGASRRTVFRRVFFPLSLPALAAGSILVFILTFGFFITPAILGGGRVPMVANALDLLINQFARWETAAALSTVLLVVTLACFAVSRWVGARGATS